MAKANLRLECRRCLTKPTFLYSVSVTKQSDTPSSHIDYRRAVLHEKLPLCDTCIKEMQESFELWFADFLLEGDEEEDGDIYQGEDKPLRPV